jgi:hypothetical protein
MNCKEFREKMYLRNDELEAQVLSDLELHRLECGECRTEYARVASMQRITDTMKTQNPELTDPLLLTNSILNRIKEDALRKHSLRPESFFDQFVILMATPSLRMTMAIMLFFITGTFAIEYTSGYVYLKGFEERINESNMQQENVSASLISQGNLLNTAEYFYNIVSGKQASVEVSENWVLMDKKSFKIFLLLYDELKDNASKLSPEFRAANPHLSKLLTVDQQSVQLDMLLKEREALIHELNRLVPKERKMP